VTNRAEVNLSVALTAELGSLNATKWAVYLSSLWISGCGPTKCDQTGNLFLRRR
jgi:hypothetical protein